MGALKKCFITIVGKQNCDKKGSMRSKNRLHLCLVSKVLHKTKKRKLNKILGNGLNNVTHFFLMSDIHQSQTIIIELLPKIVVC
jgi:hypothetical protein